MTVIPTRMQNISDRVSASIYFGRDYNYDEKNRWSVNLQYRYEDVKAEVASHGATFEEALDKSWSKLDLLISKGLGASAMMPAIEGPKNDDNIPF